MPQSSATTPTGPAVPEDPVARCLRVTETGFDDAGAIEPGDVKRRSAR